MKNNTKVIKCSCCEKKLKTYNKEVEKTSYGYVYSVNYYKELETFICDGEGKEEFGEYFCNDCLENIDESIRQIELKNGQDFIDNLDEYKQNLEKELLEKIEQLKQEYSNKTKELETRVKRVEAHVKYITKAKNMKSIDFKEINLMIEEGYPFKLYLLSNYKKDFPIKPLLEQDEIFDFDKKFICPACGDEIYKSWVNDYNCHHCGQLLKWDGLL